jgi:hypothetical protein
LAVVEFVRYVRRKGPAELFIAVCGIIVGICWLAMAALKVM